MPLFPLFLDLGGRRCLVVGAGAVGRDKIRSLAEAGAEVLVVDPLPAPDVPGFLALAAGDVAHGVAGGVAARSACGDPAGDAAPGRINVETREFRPGDCDGRVLVFACTNDPHVNAAVVAAAAERGVLACMAGTAGHPRVAGVQGGSIDVHAGGEPPAAASGDQSHVLFTTAAVLRRGQLCVAISSGGASPALAAAARDRIASAIGDEFGEAAAMLAQLRRRLNADVADAGARHAALRTVVASGLLELLRDGRRRDADALVEDALERARRGIAQHGSPGHDGPHQHDEEQHRCTR